MDFIKKRSFVAGLSFLCFVFTTCKKDNKAVVSETVSVEEVTTTIASGPGDNPNAINGYLSAIFLYGYKGLMSMEMNCHSVFSLTKQDLMQNKAIHDPYSDAGMVSFNEHMISRLPETTFDSNYNLRSVDFSTRWAVEGYAAFVLKTTVPRGFPTFFETEFPRTEISVSGGYYFDVSKIIKYNLPALGNYDSLFVEFNIPASPTPIHIKKILLPGYPIVLSKSEVETATVNSNSYAEMKIEMYNYSNQVIKGKKYIFMLGLKTNVHIPVKP